MAPITEISSFTLKSPESIQPLSKILEATFLKQPGCLRVRWSALHEDPSQARAFIDWEDISAHEAFISGASYASFLEQIAPFIVDGSKPDYHHVKFDPFPMSVLDIKDGKTPVVEILHVYFPADNTFTPSMADQAHAGTTEFLTTSLPSAIAAGSTGHTALGWTVEPVPFRGGVPHRALVVLAGWESLEAHGRYRASEEFEKGQGIMKRIEGLRGVSVVHVSLTTVERE